MKASYPIGCYVVGVALVMYIFLALTILVVIHLNAVPILATRELLRTHFLCGAFGMLGAAMASSRKYYKVLITESAAKTSGLNGSTTDWSLGWLFYYLTRPLLGAVLGALAYTLTFIGFQVLSKLPTEEISDRGRYLLYALAFVSGFSVSHVLDRLEAISKEIFQASGRTNSGGS